MKRDLRMETANAEKARLHEAARADLAKCRKRKRELFDKYHQARRALLTIIEMAERSDAHPDVQFAAVAREGLAVPQETST